MARCCHEEKKNLFVVIATSKEENVNRTLRTQKLH